MSWSLNETGISPVHCAEVVVKNRGNALHNPVAAYPLGADRAYVEASSYFSYPMREAEMAKPADGCAVVVLASHERAS